MNTTNKKWFQRITRLALATGLAISLVLGSGFALTAQAQTEELRVLNDIGQGTDRILTSDWVELAPGDVHVYYFIYAGGNQAANVWLDALPLGGATFEIWTAERLVQASADPAVGPLATGAVLTQGVGTLSWQGTSAEAETYHIIVRNTGNTVTQYALNISSPGLALLQPGALTLDSTVDPNLALQLAPDIAVNVATVTAPAGLNVRSGPGINYPILTTVVNGTQLVVLGTDANNTWLSVQLADGTVGWVSRAFTTLADSTSVVLSLAPLPRITTEGVVIPEGTAQLATTPEVAAPSIAPLPGQSHSFPNTAAETQALLDANRRVLPAGESRWYTFQLSGNGEPVHIWMDADADAGVGFRIYSEENAQAIMAGSSIEDVEDIGRGTPNEDEPGDLFWRGAFEEHGTFYVLVENRGQSDITYSIVIAGPGLAG